MAVLEARALGHGCRQKTLLLLRAKCPMTLQEIADVLRRRQASTSKNIQILNLAGFVTDRRRGRRVAFDLTKKARQSKILWWFLEKGML